MRKTIGLVCAIVATSATALPLLAQDGDDVVAYVAMVFTPIGALPPQVTPAMAGETQTRTRLRAQYGRLEMNDAVAFNNLGVGIDVGRGRGSMGLTLGYGFDDCETECDGVLMVGGHLEGVLTRAEVGARPGGGRMTMGLRGDVGLSRANESTALSAVVGVPIALTLPVQELRFVPFLTPGFGFGLIGGDDTRSGVRFLLGGGIGVMSGTGFVINLGFQRVFIEDGDTMLGINVAWNIGR